MTTLVQTALASGAVKRRLRWCSQSTNRSRLKHEWSKLQGKSGVRMHQVDAQDERTIAAQFICTCENMWLDPDF
jgi:hypothetical protein